MKGQNNGPALSVVFVDYDNIYLSLKRKNEEAARRFAKDAGGWLRGIETGRLITSTQGMNFSGPRRIVLNRCYGNPAPRRNSADNSTDMNSFPFMRQHFLRAGFEVIDCPPLTGQLKNSADIKMVMDVLDFIKHQTYFEEFILLSGDADFTPVLHRLRAHARRTVVYANDHTASAYTAISDGEIREADLITMLMEGKASSPAATPQIPKFAEPQAPAQLVDHSTGIVAEVVATVRHAGQPVPLEALADKAIRILGHDNTVGTGWGGAGTFRDLMLRRLPADLRMSEQPPYYIYSASRELTAPSIQTVQPQTVQRETAQREARRLEPAAPQMRATAPMEPARQELRQPAVQPSAPRTAMGPVIGAMTPANHAAPHHGMAPAARYTPPGPQNPLQSQQLAPAPRQAAPAPMPSQPQAAPQQPANSPSSVQQSIARIHAASKAPPLSPPDYRALFEGMAEELTANGLNGAQTIANIAQRTLQHGADIHRDDIQLIMEVVSEPDPWFEQGASPALLASRFRNYVIAQCRRHGMTLSATEIDLIEMWFSGSAPVVPRAQPEPQSLAPSASDGFGWRGQQREAPHQGHQGMPMPQQSAAPSLPPRTAAPAQPRADRWWHLNDAQTAGQGEHPAEQSMEDDLPRIMRTRLRP